MDYSLIVLARQRIPSPCCQHFLLYNGCRFPSGEELDRFLCPQCGRSYSLAEALAARKGRRPKARAQLALPLGPRREAGAKEKHQS